MKKAVGPHRRCEAMPARGHAKARARGAFALLALSLALAMPASAVETSVLLSPAPASGAEMAYAVDLDGTRIVLGAPGEDAIAGAVYVVDCATLPCTTPLRIAPDDVAANDTFGAAVGVSGDTVVATAIGSEPGAAYVYISDGNAWTQQAKLTPSGGSPGERFGVSASLSGDRLAIGADHANGQAGAVYVFVRNGTTWMQEARLMAGDPRPFDTFGTSIALDTDTLLVGAPMKPAAGLGAYANGAAYVFARDAGGWSQQAKLTNAASANGDLFGFAVALAGDRAVIGAPYALSGQGIAYVYAQNGGAWLQQTQLAADGGAAGDEFGWSVAIGDQNILVGAPFAGQLVAAPCGGSYVFDVTQMTQDATGTVSAPLVDDLSGWALAASGERWISSAPGHMAGAQDHAGAAYWFDPLITLFHAGFDVSGACAAAEGREGD